MIDNDADAAYRNRVKENYGFSEWGGHTKEGDRHVRLTNVLLITEEFKGWELAEKEDLPASARQLRVLRYVFSASKDRRMVSTIFECNSVLDAHESLIDVVMTYMAPKLPRCETKGLEIGDVCFAGHGEINLSVIFARFNILAEIQRVGTVATSVDEFAKSVDALIYSRYTETKVK
jgi:hypothetical protein